jgi:hypothetical protein
MTNRSCGACRPIAQGSLLRFGTVGAFSSSTTGESLGQPGERRQPRGATVAVTAPDTSRAYGCAPTRLVRFVVGPPSPEKSFWPFPATVVMISAKSTLDTRLEADRKCRDFPTRRRLPRSISVSVTGSPSGPKKPPSRRIHRYAVRRIKPRRDGRTAIPGEALHVRTGEGRNDTRGSDIRIRFEYSAM